MAKTKDDHEEINVLEQKILHVLKVWPRINFSMLRVGVGTAVPGHHIRQVLEDLVAENKVKYEFETEESPSGRANTYDHYSLV